MRRLSAPVACALALAACGPGEHRMLKWTDSTSIVQSVGGPAGTTAPIRFDADVSGWFEGQLTSEEHELIVILGSGPGTDQACIVVLGPRGERRATYRLPRSGPYRQETTNGVASLGLDGPWGRTASAVLPVTYGDRRLLAVSCVGATAPVPFVLLEGGDHELSPLAEVWSFGHQHGVVSSGRYLVVWGLDNSRMEISRRGPLYANSIAVFDLERLPARGHAASTTALPQGRALESGIGPATALLFYATLPFDDDQPNGNLPVGLEDDRAVLVPTTIGLRYRIALPTGEASVTADDEYRERYQVRAVRNAEADVDAHLTQLARTVEIVRPSR